MSSVSLSASGARSLSTTVNDPAATKASMPTKAGDSFNLSASSIGEARMMLPASARLERRNYSVTQSVRQKSGVYENVPEERIAWVLVLPSFSSMFLRANSETAWPHLSVDVRDISKAKGTGGPSDEGKHFYESGELLETITLIDLGLAEQKEGDTSSWPEFIAR